MAAVLAILIVAIAGACSPASATAPPVPAASADLEIVWDIQGSTDEGGRGPYFTEPRAPKLRPGPVFVAWSCSGIGTLRVVPATVARDSDPPPATSPLAFTVDCPTPFQASLLPWKPLATEAFGGENLVQIRAALEPSPNIAYRIVFGQPELP
jgi:hypothetical protein